jgi:hypothetical protein
MVVRWRRLDDYRDGINMRRTDVLISGFEIYLGKYGQTNRWWISDTQVLVKNQD